MVFCSIGLRRGPNGRDQSGSIEMVVYYSTLQLSAIDAPVIFSLIKRNNLAKTVMLFQLSFISSGWR